jgi:hypothetical protein
MMRVRQRRAHVARLTISAEVVDACRREDYRLVARLMGLRPWHAQPPYRDWRGEIEPDETPPAPQTSWADSRGFALALTIELDKLAGKKGQRPS